MIEKYKEKLKKLLAEVKSENQGKRPSRRSAKKRTKRSGKKRTKRSGKKRRSVRKSKAPHDNKFGMDVPIVPEAKEKSLGKMLKELESRAGVSNA